MNNKTLFIILMGFILLFISSTTYFILISVPQSQQEKPSSKVLDDCFGLDLEETSECLRQELKEFYNYNMDNQNNHLTLDELKEQGGVCWHYSNWYGKRARELGYFVEEVIIYIIEEDRHQFAVISDDTGYCILDQDIKIKCNKLEVNLNETT